MPLMTTSVANDPELTNWLWLNATSSFYGADLVGIRVCLIQALTRTCHIAADNFHEGLFSCLLAFINEEIKEQYLAGAFTLLPLLTGSRSVDSWCSGRAFLDVFAKLGLNAKVCMDMELRREPLLLCTDGLYHRVTFEEFDGAIEDLRWEWAYELRVPGYQVVTEFNGLSGDSRYAEHWPFLHFESVPAKFSYYEIRDRCQAARFDRRLATKARKERARTGQKRPRSKMPGAWTW
jgi:hypothetical protein